MAELHLQRLCAGSETQQLMAQADAEGRNPAVDEDADRGDGVIARCRVAGAVGQEHTVGIHRERIGGGRLRRHHGHVAAAFGEHAQDVALHAEIVGHHFELRFSADEGAAVEIELACAPDERLAGADHFRQIHALEAGKLAGGFERFFDIGAHIERRTGHHRAVLRAAIAQQACEFAGVDLRNRDDAAGFQPFRQRDLAAPTAGAARHVAHDQAGRPDVAGLVVEIGAAGVADVGIRERDQLTGVGRIGQDFLIAGHGRIEHDLAHGQAGRAYGFALEYGAVFED